MKFSTLFSLLVIAILLPFTSQADTCMTDNTDGLTSMMSTITVPSGGLIGQQFIACETGSLTAINVNIDFAAASGIGNLDLYLVSGNGSTIVSGSPLKTFTGVSEGFITLNLAEGEFEVTEGTLYAFAVGGLNMDVVTFDDSPVGGPPDPSVANGHFVFFFSGGVFQENPASDLFFSTSVSFTPPVVEPIPTMSEWGLLIFGLLVLNLGVFGIRRKEVII